jgi:F0F1-type ATP synthase membrane subunit c/vacuolar-type H+-ATPase subunit K
MRASRWNLAALIVAAMMVMAAAGALVWGISARQDAQATLHQAEATLTHERSRSTDATAQLTKAQTAARGLRPQMGAVTAAGDAVAPLDDQSLAAVKAAVAAGIAGNVAGYNAAVAQLNATNAGHDAALEQLRVQVNALVIALDPLRG